MVSEHGQIVKEAETESEPERLVRWLEDLASHVAAVGLEAGPLSQWLYRGLTKAGLEVVLMETRQVKGALKAMPIKTDRRDAEGIAQAFFISAGSARSTVNPSRLRKPGRCSARERLSCRNMIALEMSRSGLLRYSGLKVGAISDRRFETRIRDLADGNPMLETATAPMLRARASRRQELAGLEMHVRQFAGGDPVCWRLMTMPGIGAVVRSTDGLEPMATMVSPFRASIDDPKRFRSSKRIGPWVRSDALSQAVR